jgi:phosphoribosyl 1,2-cyclic phosphodiesterase
MVLFTASLNSGSNGNCYYIGNKNEAVLIDAGISCRETEKRMARMGLRIQSVKAIFISHEHSDHIRGVEVLSKKHKIPVYITELTRRSGGLNLIPELENTFKAHEAIKVGGLEIVPFPKEHDASDPYSFIVKNEKVTIGVMTDIGTACEHVVNYFKQCHAVYLESNYDVEMLQNGQYPVYLKKRISSDKGHLSNLQAQELFRDHRSEFLSHVFLSHLSAENNDPKTAASFFNGIAGGAHVVVASRHKESAIFCIKGEAAEGSEMETMPGVQMGLF